MTPADILELLRAAMSLGAMLLNLGYRADTQQGAQAMAAKIEPAHREMLTSETGARLLEALIIDEVLLRDLVQQVEEVQAHYRYVLLNARDANERRQADKWAEREICDHLSRIRARNGGVLPLAALQSVWESYGCAAAEASRRAWAGSPLGIPEGKR